MSLAFRESVSAFKRSPLLSILGVVTIAFSLFAFGLFGLVAVNIRQALNNVEERVEIRAFIADGTPVESAVTAVDDILDFPEVKSAVYTSKDQALKRARQELGEFKDVFEAGFLPASIDIKLKPGSRDPESVRKVAQKVSHYRFVDDIRYGEEWVEKLNHLKNIATIVGAGLGAAFAAVAIIIIGATIRMAVLAREREITIMRLVGATDWFVRKPFIIEGFLKGLLGGLLALLITWIANGLINRSIIKTVFFEPKIALLGILAGALIGTLGSMFSVGRHLRRI